MSDTNNHPADNAYDIIGVRQTRCSISTARRQASRNVYDHINLLAINASTDTSLALSHTIQLLTIISYTTLTIIMSSV